jgi:hypothetical protein
VGTVGFKSKVGLAVGVLVLASCVNRPHFYSPDAAGTVAPSAETVRLQTHLTTQEVVQLARRAAENAGYRLDEFEAPMVDFEPFVHDKKWFVFFYGKVPAPGNHFLVIIDDESRAVRVWPGE